MQIRKSVVALKRVSSFLKARPTRADRMAAGRSLRESVPLEQHAQLEPKDRHCTPVEILREQASIRNPALIPIRHARMLQSPFSFYRGGAAIMAMDLNHTPRTDIQVQLCGDMHLGNFGFFATSEHRLVFGINDFDETLPGSWEWDIKRLAASAAIASRSLERDREHEELCVRRVVGSYRQHMREYSRMGYRELSQQYIDQKAIGAAIRHEHLPVQVSRHLRAMIRKSRSRSNLQALEKLTDLVDKDRRIVDNPPLVEHLDVGHLGVPIVSRINDGLISYRDSLLTDRRQLLEHYRLVDYARKVVGVGSVGTSCWLLYFEGLDEKDPLFLQYKQASESVLAPYLGTSIYRSQGHRVVAGQRLLQGAPDIFLGYGEVQKIHFYIRQLRDMKGGIRIGPEGIGAGHLPSYCMLFGMALALGHARSGEPALIAGYLGRSERFDDAIVRFSRKYADLNDKDYETFSRAIRAGELSVSEVF